MLIDGNDVTVGMTVKFRTINAYDLNLWTGEVIGFVHFDIARVYTDVVAYQQNVLKDNPDVSPVAELQFLIIKTVEGINRAFAIDWIQPTSLVIVDTSNNVNIVVYNVTSGEADTIITLLKNNNYNCAVV